MTKPASSLPKRSLLAVAGLALLCYAVLPQIGSFRSALTFLLQAQGNWVGLAAGCVLYTYMAAAATYHLLSWHRLPYRQTLLVQVASMFVNRLLPAGIGALGANYLYLRHARHTASQAAAAVTANNVLGFLGHMVLVGLLLLTRSGRLSLHWRPSGLLITGMVAGAIAVITLAGWRRRSTISRLFTHILQQIAQYRRRPQRLLGALASSMTLTVANVLCLWACAQAIGLQASLVQLFVAFSFGVGAGSVVPTPGGLGAVEAGLLAALVAYGLPHGPALAAVLLFRLCNYWFGLAAGAVAFMACQQRKLFTAKY